MTTTIVADGTARHANQGKLRVDLVPLHAQEQYVRVLMYGAHKYGVDNWRRGLPWVEVVASAERHVMQWMKNEENDAENGLPHLAHVMCNAAFVLEYYDCYPQGDNRRGKAITAAPVREAVLDTAASKRAAVCDGDALRFDLVPLHAQEAYIRALEVGACKHQETNWRENLSIPDTLASLLRHLHEWKKGEDNDNDSQCRHLAHVMCDAAFLLEISAT